MGRSRDGKKHTNSFDEANGENYLGKLKEWQEHQYDPGYYTGGRIPPIYTHPGKPAWLGWTFAISSGVFALWTLMIVLQGFGKGQLLEKIIVICVALSIFSLQFVAGVRLITKGKIQGGVTKRKLNVRIFVLVVCLGVFICAGAIVIYSISINVEEIVVSAREQIVLRQNSGDNYVYFKSTGKTLKCSIDDYFVLWSMEIGDDSHIKNTMYKIRYQWSSILPQMGKVISVVEVSQKE